MRKPINPQVPPSAIKLIGEMLLEERSRQGLSFSECKRLSGLESWQIKDLEDGSKETTLETLIRYLYALNLNIRFTEQKIWEEFMPDSTDN